MRFRVLLIAFLLVTAALHAWADVVMEESEASGSSSEAQKVMIYATANRLAVQEGTAGMIFLADKQVLWQYDTGKSVYIEFTPQSMKVLKEKTDALLADEVKKIKQQMKGMPADQKAEMQKAIDRMEHGDRYAFEKLGAERTVNGWKCVPIQVLVNGEEREKLCVAALAEVGLSARDIEVFDALDKFYGNLGTSGSAGVFNLPGLEKFLGYRSFPVEETSPGRSGEDVILLQSIKHGPVPANIFVLPPGLKKQSLFGFP